MTIVLYRAMCGEEAKKSIEDQRPDFIRRYKWFSPSLDFVTKRIKDGKFNNSQFRPERYTNILTFEFSERAKDYFTKVGNKEWSLDRRKFPLIGVISVRKINNGRMEKDKMSTQEFERNWEVEGNLDELIKVLKWVHPVELPKEFEWPLENNKKKFSLVNKFLVDNGIYASNRLHEELKDHASENLGIELDLDKLKSISWGYIANAADSMILRLMEDPVGYSAKLQLRLRYHNGIIRSDVEDNGKGIDEYIQPSIFLKSCWTTKYDLSESIDGVLHGGGGCKLKYARDDTAKLKGRVGFHNKGKDKGAIFWYEMPIESVIKQNAQEER